MGEFDVIQRTSDGYFDANILLRQWNKDIDNPQRKMEVFLYSTNTKEFIDALIEENNLGQNCPKIDIQVVKKSRVKEDGKAGRPVQQVWMHKYLFLKFAMWLNPRFEVKVIKFVYDEMIKYRHEAGDEYRALGCSAQKIVETHFMPTAMAKIGEALNWIVFNKHEKGIRNKFGKWASLMWFKERRMGILTQIIYCTIGIKIQDTTEETWINFYLPRRQKNLYQPSMNAKSRTLKNASSVIIK